jgi:hypothetical protein
MRVKRIAIFNTLAGSFNDVDKRICLSINQLVAELTNKASKLDWKVVTIHNDAQTSLGDNYNSLFNRRTPSQKLVVFISAGNESFSFNRSVMSGLTTHENDLIIVAVKTKELPLKQTHESIKKALPEGLSGNISVHIIYSDPSIDPTMPKNEGHENAWEALCSGLVAEENQEVVRDTQTVDTPCKCLVM